MSKTKRKGRTFIDYLRNGRGATAIASYSTRAALGAPIATPLRWEELDGLKSSREYTISNIRRRLSASNADPWKGFFDLPQRITAGAMKDAGYRP